MAVFYLNYSTVTEERLRSLTAESPLDLVKKHF